MHGSRFEGSELHCHSAEKRRVCAADLKVAAFTAAELKAAAFTAAELKAAAFTAAELRVGGYSAAQVKSAGFRGLELQLAGFTRDEIVAAHGFCGCWRHCAGYGICDAHWGARDWIM